MREIKFRVWDLEMKSFYSPNVHYLSKHGGIVEIILNSSVKKISGENRFIIQQYTGLKDKNGKEIYEGDICDVGMVIGPVEFIIGSFSLASNPLIEFLPKNICAFDPDFDPSWIDVTVIGNIYEKPELLNTTE